MAEASVTQIAAISAKVSVHDVDGDEAEDAEHQPVHGAVEDVVILAPRASSRSPRTAARCEYLRMLRSAQDADDDSKPATDHQIGMLPVLQ